MQMRHERGVALVITLFLLSAMSVLAASLMFLSQTEIYASMNYGMMSQARYGAESGVQKAADFLLDPTQYSPPAASGSDLLASYNYTVSPVTYAGHPVILSAVASQPSNYPYAAAQTAFAAAAQGSMAAGATTINFGAYATLIAMQTFTAYGGGTGVVQTWQITSNGTLAGSRPATVQVSGLIETPKVPANSYAAFATDPTCGALTFIGTPSTDSYNPAGLTGATNPTISGSGGDVGTNGNLTISGHVQVQGNLYTPRTGVGSCTTGNVTALTESGAATVTGSMVQLPKAQTYPTPKIPAASPIPAVSLSSAGTSATTCPLLGLTAGPQCSVSGSTITINGMGSTLSLPSISLTSHVNLVLTGGGPPAAEYDIAAISLAGGASIGMTTASPTQTVLIDVSGLNPDGSTIATPIDLGGGAYSAVTGCASCSAFDAGLLQFVYGGTGTINLKGNSSAAATFYAPNAQATVAGTADVYGSILAKDVTVNGTFAIHYDTNLQSELFVAGNPMLTTFSWKRY